MLFKNNSLSESDLETLFLKRFLWDLHLQALISLRSVMSLSSSIKCLTVVFIAFVFRDSKRTLSVFLHVDTIHICYGFLHLLPFYHKYFRVLDCTSYKRWNLLHFVNFVPEFLFCFKICLYNSLCSLRKKWRTYISCTSIFFFKKLLILNM